MYLVLKHTHMTCAVLTILLFTLRGYWMLINSSALQQRWVKIVPHIIDTVLLTTAIVMTITISQYPFTADWLTAKLIALIAYIVLGSIALKRGKTKAIRVAALLLAWGCVGYIFWVARAHYPWPWLI